MPNAFETFALAQIERIASENGPVVKAERVLRTYASRNRAEEDRDLLARVSPGDEFEIVELEHIDS